MYADDTVIFYTNPCPVKIMSVLKQDLNKLQDWTISNRLCLHSGKTEFVLFGTRQKISSVDSFQLYFNDEQIKKVQSYEYLGAMLDENLNFKEHLKRSHPKS